MKKIVPRLFVKFSLLFIVFCILVTKSSFAQDCKTQAASKPSTLVRGTDDVSSNTGKMNAAEMAKMKPHLSIAENWAKKILTNFTGAKLLYSNNFFPVYLKDGTTNKNLYEATGIKSYYSAQMRFFAYYCYDNSNTIHTEVESGSTIYVKFNNVFSSGFTESEGVFRVNGKPAFKVIQKKRSEGRIDFYEQRAQNNADAKMYTANDYIILRNSDKPVFVAVTRKEYLEQMLKDAEAFGDKNTKQMTENLTQNAKQFEAEMKVYKEMDKNYTPEKEAKRRKWFEEDQEKFKKTISKINPDADAAKATMLQYLQKPQDWLNKTVKRFYDNSTYTAQNIHSFFENLDKIRRNGVGEIQEETAEEIVTINPAYFNKTLSSDIPQLIMVELRNGTYAHMVKVAALVKQPGALAPLEAILNPGKSASPIVIPTEIVSTYSLKYLPKLKSLTPLIVPAAMKPSVVPVTATYNNTPPAVALNFSLPVLSAKLNQLPQLATSENYSSYIQQLHNSISSAIKPIEKKKADDYVKNKKITQSKEISNAAFAAWLQNAPTASLYLYSKAVLTNTSDVLAANNFAAFLIMGGLPEKSIPILEYLNKQKTGEASILSNLGNAYYRLGDLNKAMNYLQQCVQKDSLQPTANKMLCMMYLKKGDTKKAKDHGTRSLTTSHDEQVISILRQLDDKIKPGEIMSRLPAKEFPMLKRVKLPAMPSTLDDMEKFRIELEAERKSLEITIANIESKMPKVNDDVKQQLLMTKFTKGISPLGIKAQYIIMDAMQTYQREMIRENDVFNYNRKLLVGPYSIKVNAISKKYSVQLNKLEGGEAGDEDEIAALEMARCKELNAETEKYLAGFAPLVNGFAQRLEFITRKFYRDYANWAPYWMPETTISFPSIEKDYLNAVSNILSQYTITSKNNCTPFEPLPKKEGKLQKWEDEYCANFTGAIGMGGAALEFDCNSWSIEGGEGILGKLEMNYADDGSFEDFTIGAGPGVSWDIAGGGIAKIEAGASVKEFIKIGVNKATGKFEVKDFGLKADVTLEGNIGTAKREIKILEISAAVNAGVSAGGVVAPILNLQ